MNHETPIHATEAGLILGLIALLSKPIPMLANVAAVASLVAASLTIYYRLKNKG